MKSHRSARAFLLLGATLTLLSVIFVGVMGWRTRQAALVSRERITELRQGITGEGLPSVVVDATASSGATGGATAGTEGVRQTCAQLGQLQRDLQPVIELTGVVAPAGGLIGQLPQVGDQASATLALARATGDISGGLTTACDAVEPVLQAQASSPDAFSSIGALVEGLGASREQIRAATARLQAAQGQLATIDERVLDEGTRQFLVQVRDRLPTATTRLALLAEVPTLLGYDGPRHFLILGQNNDEIRATGGFIGTSGVMTFDQGRVVRQEFGASSRFNVPPDRVVLPPEPIQRDLGGTYWHLRSSNWWPDFPSSALQARYFYNLVRQDEIAGVVALDQDLLELLLGVTGPIDVPQYGEVVSAENVRDRLEYHVHSQGGGGVEEVRKGFVGALFGQIVEQLTALPKDRLPELTSALTRGLEEQHLLLWTEDARAQQAIGDRGWDGRMLPASGDYLFPVSVNVGANKVNREVEQELAYDVGQEPDGRLIGRATLRLRNRRATSDPGPYPTADYRDYLRVYVPPGSELVSTAGFTTEPRTIAECGRTAFTGIVVVPPGKERRVELTYRLPSTLDAANYSLLVQKQPGVPAFPMSIRASLGAGSEVKGTLNGHGLFRVGDAALSPAGRGSASPAGASNPACDVYTGAPRVLAAPANVRIPKLDVQSGVVGLGVLPGGQLDAPTTGDVIGWYGHTARPGQVGNMLASGHVDWEKRPAVFWRLAELKGGDRIEVTAEDGGRHEYAVQWVTAVDAANAPLDEIVGPTTERWLTLITCGGTFNRVTRDYSDRVIVRAKLVGPE